MVAILFAIVGGNTNVLLVVLSDPEWVVVFTVVEMLVWIVLEVFGKVLKFKIVSV